MLPPVQFRLSLNTRSPVPVSVPEDTFSATPVGRVSGVVVAMSSVPPAISILVAVPVTEKPSLMVRVPPLIATEPLPSAQFPVSTPLAVDKVNTLVPATISALLLSKLPLPLIVCEALTLYVP